MTNREHSRILAEGRIEKLNALRNALIDTAHAIFDVMAYDDQHILDCKHQGPSVDDLQDIQRDKEAVEQQISAIKHSMKECHRISRTPPEPFSSCPWKTNSG